MAEINGTEGADALDGTQAESNVIHGLGGDDTLTGGFLEDSLFGDDGDDLLSSGDGVANLLSGGAGSDTLIGATREFFWLDTHNRLEGGEGDDLIVGGLFDTLIGGAGNDTLQSLEEGGGSLFIRAGSGDDFIHVDAINGAIDGGDGVDRLMTHGRLQDISIANVEILEVGGHVSTSGALLEAFEIIRPLETGGRVYLGVSGSVDIHRQLGDTPVNLGIALSNNDKYVVGEGDDSINAYGGDAWVEGRGGDDTIQGSNGDVTLFGGDGDDQIAVQGERFTIDAGAGNDFVRVNATVRSALVEGGDGRDLLVAGGDVRRAVFSGFEELRVDGSIIATGNQLEAFETISARGAHGAVRIVLAGSHQADLAEELGSRRANIMASAADDTIVSGAGDDLIYGLGGDDIVHGGAGSDRLIMSAGRDQLFGDDGDDLFELDLRARSTIEGGSGRDALVVGRRSDAPIDLSACAIADVEVLAIGDVPVRATAEQFEGFDSIVGVRPIVKDMLELELAKSGAVDLSEELLALRAQVLGTNGRDVIRTGAGDDLIIGSGGDDSLEGSDGDDILIGDNRTVDVQGADTLAGGAGRDILKGGGGDDVYILEDALDRIKEFSNDGIDTVLSSVTYVLEAGLENLQLSGPDAINGTGNRLLNEISGNGADNIIDGLRGADTLRGGEGDDVFMFTTHFGQNNADEILDFGLGDDRIGLDEDMFGDLPEGALEPGAFKDISMGEVDADDRILYDARSGELYFDADGDGRIKMVLFAHLRGAPSLSSEDFLIV